MTSTERLLAHADRYAASFTGSGMTAVPATRVAVVACMDARINIFGLFGLAEGDAHVIRNAGGTVTEETLRSLVISQRMLGTREIILVHHTGCGMLNFSDEDFAATIEAETGLRPTWAAGAFADLHDDVRQSMARIAASPFVAEKRFVRGFVFDVDTGKLEEVDPTV
jgi:carbonic anhydrase